MKREIFHICQMLWKHGFTDYTLRVILNVFIDSNCHLAETLRDYDVTEQTAKRVSMKFTKHQTVMTFYSTDYDGMEE